MPALMGNDFQRKLLARLRTDVRQRRADGGIWQTQRWRRQFVTQSFFWVGFSPEILKPDCVSTRSRGNSSDLCLFYTWAGLLNGPKLFKRRPRNEAWIKMAWSFWRWEQNDLELAILFLLHFLISWTWTFFQNHLSKTHGDDAILSTIYSKRSNFCFVFPSCTGCLLLFASIVYSLAALFNGSNFKSLRTGKIYSAYRL